MTQLAQAGYLDDRASGGVKAICVVLRLALLAMLAYYLLPWEVWLKCRIDRRQAGGAV